MKGVLVDIRQVSSCSLSELCGCFFKLGVLFVRVLKIRAILLGVCIRAPDFLKLLHELWPSSEVVMRNPCPLGLPGTLTVARTSQGFDYGVSVTMASWGKDMSALTSFANDPHHDSNQILYQLAVALGKSTGRAWQGLNSEGPGNSFRVLGRPKGF